MPFYYQSHGKPPPNKFVAAVRRIYNPLGFQRGYNFPLWIIFAGAALGFCLSRMMYFNYDGDYRENTMMTGDWQYHRQGLTRIGAMMHLFCVLPIGLLLPWQFLPIVRHKFILFHRVSGYILILLLMVGNAGAIIIAPRSLGGSIELQTLVGVLAISTTVCMLLAYINVKRLQLDQHRAWMLRGWFLAFIIVTLRLIQLAAVEVISALATFYVPFACNEIDFVNSEIAPDLSAVFYPECAGNPDKVVSVLASGRVVMSEDGIPGLHQITAAIQCTFAMSTLLAILLHGVGIEIYLRLTQAEANRLKRVSRQRQRERGWARPGDASWLTKETWGDCDEFDYEDGSAIGAKDNTSEINDGTDMEIVDQRS